MTAAEAKALADSRQSWPVSNRVRDLIWETATLGRYSVDRVALSADEVIALRAEGYTVTPDPDLTYRGYFEVAWEVPVPVTTEKAKKGDKK